VISLDDDSMIALMDACRPLRLQDRDQFIRALAGELEKHRPGEVGPGLVHRLARDLQRRFFDAPVGTMGGKYD
jgi:hypothetical protein